MGQTLAVIHIHRQIVIASYMNYNDSTKCLNHLVYEHAARVSS